MKIPIRYDMLKRLYKEIGLNWISTRDFKDLGVSKPQMYSLKYEKSLEKYLFINELQNYDGSLVSAQGSEKIGNFWRITGPGLLKLCKYFKINIDDSISFIAKELLLGEFNEN